MSIGNMPALGGGLTVQDATPCICQEINPILYPPDPCCIGSGGGTGCPGDGNGSGGSIGPAPVSPGGGGNGGSGGSGGSCCSDNGSGPFVGPGGNGGGSSCSSCGSGGGTPYQSPGSGGGDGGGFFCLLGTYGGGGRGIPQVMGNLHNGAVLLPLGGGASPCQITVGTAPAPVPSSSAPFSQTVSVGHNVPVGQNPAVSELWVTCVDTGVTLTSSCSNLVFYHNVGGTKTYTTPGGPALACNTGLGFSALSTQGSGTVPNAVTLIV